MNEKDQAIRERLNLRAYSERTQKEVEFLLTELAAEREKARKLRWALECGVLECICGHIGSQHIRYEDGSVKCGTCDCEKPEWVGVFIESEIHSAALAPLPASPKETR